MLSSLVVSVLLAASLAIILVEKGEDWPVSYFLPLLKGIAGFFHPKLVGMFDCTVCCSFWAALAGDLFLHWIWGAPFLWPISGFVACGLVWTLIQLLNALDKDES
jgi:hypothetical protein